MTNPDSACGSSPSAARGAGLNRRLAAAAPYVLILAVAALFYRFAERMHFDRVAGRIGPDAWPKLILALLMLTCAYGAVRAGLSPPAADPPAAASPGEDAGAPDDREIHPQRVWAALAGALAYVWVMPLVGFFLSTLVFLGFIFYVGGYRRGGRLILLALAGSLLFTTVFVRVVYVSLPLGAAPFNRVSLALLALLNS